MKKFICVISIILSFTILFCSCTKEVPEPPTPQEVTDDTVMKLTNPNADETTQKVYSYICETYKNAIISGQQESTWHDGTEYEMNYVYETTGKLPAMRGLDFTNDDFDGVVSRAADWWNRGGLVTICWHCGSDFTGTYEGCRYDDIEDWDAVLTEGTPENQVFMANMDNAGRALQQLQEQGVTVIWRPLHEFDGKWYWWGRGGTENFKKLWIMMYNHFTYDLGLNNLIWVLGYSHNGDDFMRKPEQWYPGDEYCDIVGADSYEVDRNGAEERLHRVVLAITNDKKPLTFHECGKMPTIEQLKETPWCSFTIWHTEYLTDTNTKEELSEIYNSDYVITLDELPEF